MRRQRDRQSTLGTVGMGTPPLFSVRSSVRQTIPHVPPVLSSYHSHHIIIHIIGYLWAKLPPSLAAGWPAKAYGAPYVLRDFGELSSLCAVP